MGIVDVVHPVKLISECFVRPKKLLEAAKHPFYLGPLDLIFLMKDPIQTGLLFPFPNDPTRPDIQPILEKLKLSLSIALVHFYTLAGRFETSHYQDGCFIYLDCTKGPGARFIHATMDLTASDILSTIDVHPAVRSFFDLGEITLNFDAHTNPMLTIQVTELLDGVFIGFTMNHSVADGTSFIHFVSALSEIFRSETQNPIEMSRIPQYKMFIPDGSDPIIKLPVHPDEVVKYMTRSDPGVLRERIFHFSTESIASVKAKANEEEECEISSFMALSGLVWRSMTRAQNLGPDDDTPCHFPVNARTRVDPRLSEDYFGNIFASVRVVCKVDQLLGQGLGWAARILAQEIKKVNHQGICDHLKKLAHLVALGPTGRDGSGSGNYVLMGWSHRFDMYGPEFGFGRALAVLMGCAGQKNGKVTVNPGREGGGSVDLQISLSPHMMKALESDEEFMSYVTLV